MHLPRFLAVVTTGVAVLVCENAWSQTERRLSAREIFYSAPSEAPPANKTAPQQVAPVKKRVAGISKVKQAPLPASTNGAARTPAAGEVIPAAYNANAAVPLGIRYSILKREGTASVEVSPDTVFRSGDRIRLHVEVNGSGSLYIVHRGSSGIWKVLFPSSETAGGDNRVEKGKTYEIPAGYVFTFDEQPGQEKLFIVLSRRPEPDLEKLIYSISAGTEPATPSKPDDGKVLLAQNLVNIDNGLVERLRNVYARDLIIEKVDDATSIAPPAQTSAAPPPKEKAVYVVNPSRSGEARVVADVTLTHQ